MKCFYGSATTSPRDNHDMIDIAPIAGADEGAEATRITRAQLIAVIRQRLDQLMGEIAGALKGLGFAAPFGRQVARTGAASELNGMADSAECVPGRALRVRPAQPPGRPKGCGGPAFPALPGPA